MSLTNEEKIRRIATPHTIDVEVEHDCTVKMAYPEFGASFGADAILSMPLDIPTARFSAINTNAHKKLKETNLFFRSSGDLATSENVFLVQNTANSATQYRYYHSGNNYIEWPYGTFLYVQKFPDDLLYFWRGNAKCRGYWNNVIVPFQMQTHQWNIPYSGACTINIPQMDLYEWIDCAFTRALLEQNGAQWITAAGVYQNTALITIPLPDGTVSNAVFYSGDTSYPAVVRDVQLNIRFQTVGGSSPVAASSIRVLSPFSMNLTGELYDMGDLTTPYASFGTETGSLNYGHVPLQSGGDDVATFDPAIYTLANTRTMAIGYANYPTLSGSSPNWVWSALPATTPNAEIVTELQPILSINPGSQFIADGYFSGGSVIRQIENITTGDRGSVFWRPSNSATTQESSGLFYQIPRIFGYENEEHEIRRQNASYEIMTKFKFNPKYVNP